MRNQSRRCILVATMALLSWSTVGCGDSTECGPGTEKDGAQCVADQSGQETPDDTNNDTPLECGAGTVVDNGECVADDQQTSCGPKTTLQDGQCVIAADACESGETLDPNSGECVADRGECGSGTALDTDSGECLATEDVCDTGTVFDDSSGLCLPDACQAGDVLVNGMCVSPAQELAGQADVQETENNDPAQGGQSNELTLKAPGETTVFTGAIGSPDDLTGNGQLDQDLDRFDFDAQAGQWLQISLQSTGIPSPIFLVQGPNGYQRLSPQLGGSDTARQLLIPADGAYTVTVAPAAYAAALLGGGATGAAAGGPYGGDDWEYVGSLAQIDAPSPADIDPSSASLGGDYATLADNFFRFDGLGAGVGVTLQIDTSQPDATGILQIWDDGEYVGATPIAEGDTIDLLGSDSDNLQVLVDWQTLGGLAGDFEISADAQTGVDTLGPIDADDTLSTDPINLEFGQTLNYTFSVDPGQIIAFSFDNDLNYAPANFTLTDPSGTLVLPSNSQIYDYESLTPGRYAYTYTKRGGTLQMEITPGNGFDLDNLIAHIATFAPTDLGAVAAGDNVEHTRSDGLDAWTSDFYTLSSTETVVVSGQISGDSSAQISANFLSESNQLIANLGVQNTTLEVQETVFEPGTMLLEVSAMNQSHAAYTVDLDVAQTTQLEVEPNGGPNLASSFDIDSALYGSVEGADDDDYYVVTIPDDMDADEVFLLEVDQLESANASYTCTLRDQDGNLVGPNNPNALRQGCLAVATDLQASNTYYLQVVSQRQHPGSPLNYKLSARIEAGLLEVEANEDPADATPFDIDALQMGTSLFGAMPTLDDTDYFSFTLAADMDPGDELQLELEQLVLLVHF